MIGPIEPFILRLISNRTSQQALKGVRKIFRDIRELDFAKDLQNHVATFVCSYFKESTAWLRLRFPRLAHVLLDEKNIGATAVGLITGDVEYLAELVQKGIAQEPDLFKGHDDQREQSLYLGANLIAGFCEYLAESPEASAAVVANLPIILGKTLEQTRNPEGNPDNHGSLISLKWTRQVLRDAHSKALDEVARYFSESAFGLEGVPRSELYVPLQMIRSKKQRNQLGESVSTSALTEPASTRKVAILMGNPGSGKSTELRKLSLNLLSCGENALYVPLQHLNPYYDATLSEPFQNALLHYLRANEIPATLRFIDPPSKRRPTVFLDGLDELVIADESDQSRIKSVVSALFDYPLRDCDVIIGSRYGAGTDFLMDYSFMGSVEEWHLLPISPLASSDQRSVTEFHDLKIPDLLPDFISRYTTAGFNPNQVQELINSSQTWTYLAAEPFTLHLAFLLSRSDNAPCSDWSIFKIYEKAIEEVFRHGYDNGGRPPSQFLRDRDRFYLYLGLVGLATLRHGGRLAPFTECREIFRIFELEQEFDRYFCAGTDGSPSLLMMFHLRPTRNSVPAQGVVEFLHKGFCEFLVARWVLVAMKELGCGLEAFQKDTPESLFKVFTRPWPMTHYHYEFLVSGLESLDQDELVVIAEHLTKPLSSAFIGQYNEVLTDIFFVTCRAISCVVQKKDMYQFMTATKDNWILDNFNGFGFNASEKRKSFRNAFTHLKCHEALFNEFDMSDLDMSNSVFLTSCFSRCVTIDTVFTGSHFSSCEFVGWTARKNNFSRCTLQQVNTEACLFYNCDFSSTTINSTTFSDSDFSYSRFSGASIKATHFDHASIFQVSDLRFSLREVTIDDVVANMSFYDSFRCSASGESLQSSGFTFEQDRITIRDV